MIQQYNANDLLHALNKLRQMINDGEGDEQLLATINAAVQEPHPRRWRYAVAGLSVNAVMEISTLDEDGAIEWLLQNERYISEFVSTKVNEDSLPTLLSENGVYQPNEE